MTHVSIQGLELVGANVQEKMTHQEMSLESELVEAQPP